MFQTTNQNNMSSIHDCTLVPWSIAIVRRRENGHDLPGGHRLQHGRRVPLRWHRLQYGFNLDTINYVVWHGMISMASLLSYIKFNDIQKSLPKTCFQRLASKDLLPRHCSWAQLKPSMTSWCARAMSFKPLDWLNFLGGAFLVDWSSQL